MKTSADKIVVNNILSLQAKVVKGKGLCTTIEGVPQIAKNGRTRSAKRVWRILLDSGADGDLLFSHPKTREYIPQKERFAPCKWRTSNGTFQTTKVGDFELLFPKFSKSKLVKMKPDIIEMPKESSPPVYDMIIGIETMSKLGVVLDFKNHDITLDHITVPMRPLRSFMDQKGLNSIFQEFVEPTATKELTDRTVKILDAKYEKADLPKVVQDNCTHLSVTQQRDLLKLLQDFEELFDGTLGDWDTEPIHLKVKEGATPYHGRPFPVPRIHLETLKKEVKRLVEIGVLKRQPESEWASPTFIIPKKSGSVRFISDFREVNKRLVRTPYPLPKISTVLQEMEGFTYATALDLNMGYYTIRLDPDSQKICTIILPWGKYSYQRLPMGICGSPDFFQERMTGLMESLEYIRCYIDDLLIITRESFEDHLKKLREVLRRLQKAGLRINATKCFFVMPEIEYLGYILTRNGIKPQPEKCTAILALKPPTTVKELRKFLGMVMYYRDLWEKRSQMIAPLTDLIGECGETKTTRKNKTKKKKFYWTKQHQESFEAIKKTIAREVMLAYPDFSKAFEIYTDASTRQLGAVITQGNRPLAFFSRKLSEAQENYNITELELLSIVETLKEFEGMLWGQKIIVYTDHKNLTRDALGLNSKRVYRWRLVLNEYQPEIIYIKGIDNTVADAISRLEYDPSVNVKNIHWSERWSVFVHLLVQSDPKDPPQYHGGDSQGTIKDSFVHNIELGIEDLSGLYVTTGDEEREIFPPTIMSIADEQRRSRAYKPYFKARKPKKWLANKRFSLKVIDDIEILVCDDKRLVIPVTMQKDILDWYHHYLMHPGENRLEETIKATMYWPGMTSQIRKHVKYCPRCQKGKKRKAKYGKLPTKIAEVTPWRCVCVDLIGPYTIKAKDGTILDFMCMTMIDPATGWFEIVELPNAFVKYERKGEDITKVIIDKSSAVISRLFNKTWLSRYPRAKYVIYDNGSEFKLHFEGLCDSFSLKRSPTTIKNPQANAILERQHAVIANMMRTSNLDMQDTITEDDVDDFVVNTAWALRSTYHTVLKTTPGAAIFGRDMMFDIPYLADWTEIGKRRQVLVERNSARENKRRIDFDYAVGQKVLLIKDGILRKAEDKHEGPYVITQVHTNGTVRIQRGSVSERLHIRRLTPYVQNDI